jgi:hypothetical protein
MSEMKKVILVADRASSAVSKAVEYLMNRPVAHTFGKGSPASFIHAEKSNAVFAEKLKARIRDSVVRKTHPRLLLVEVTNSLLLSKNCPSVMLGEQPE